ncbi:MAG: OmpA family protein [Alphaproteobacteria bacterium]|nr:OmpA family protein [Alphaproteobacteria bacterium]MBQ4130464.1 OmpA family protein [Alphaproteobacteria bacterium]MBQ8041979.1 OmpA family protein [Alphaproteobacteria bacterium]MBQ8367456.1 OmpA family protein [Alphaproteobacteria bacterium]MBQ8729353.1 OmpA family protein [Alphaproteobacteria bacterium]
MKKTISILALLSFVSACTTINPYTGQTQTAKSTWGTAIGATAGALIGSTQSSEGALIGALAGGAVGGGVGYYLDVQAAELRAELASTGVQVVESDDSIRLIMPGNITFKTDSADINSSFYPVLNSVAKVLNKYSNSTVMVSGHTDSTGSADYNLNLSRERAQSVASYLQGQGVKASRFEVLGLGSSNPIASNASAAGRAQNRRVEIKIIPNK